ncbi:hypothetical protein Xekk_02183 [Xenorhabdus sp. KK7.4]|nr:hypothetical protein Xekk_02183 [Xenorhabdus sp. KK7.4]
MAGEPSVGWFPISAKVHFIEQVIRMSNIIPFEYDGHEALVLLAPGYRRLSVLAMTCLLFIERTDRIKNNPCP